MKLSCRLTWEQVKLKCEWSHSAVSLHSRCTDCHGPADSKSHVLTHTTTMYLTSQNPQNTHSDLHYWRTKTHAHTHTHPHKNILCLLPLMLHTALLLSEREISSSVTDWSAVAVPRVRAAVSDRVWQISAATPLSRLVTSSVPTAITRPVSALHSSLICYRHSSGGAVHAGNSELLALTVYLWSRKCVFEKSKKGVRREYLFVKGDRGSLCMSLLSQ